VANECQVKQLVLFHHKPSYDDAKLDQIAAEASREFENVSCAREGDSITLCPRVSTAASRSSVLTVLRDPQQGRVPLGLLNVLIAEVI